VTIKTPKAMLVIIYDEHPHVMKSWEYILLSYRKYTDYQSLFVTTEPSSLADQ
jgi:hypothetical protein